MGSLTIRRIACTGALVLALAGGVAPAQGAYDHYSKHGSDYAGSDGSAFRVGDGECDGNWVRGNYRSSAATGGINNDHGCGTYVRDGDVGFTIREVQVCESQGGLRPMACSDWNSEY